jgi:hypothetical protein
MSDFSDLNTARSSCVVGVVFSVCVDVACIFLVAKMCKCSNGLPLIGWPGPVSRSITEAITIQRYLLQIINKSSLDGLVEQSAVRIWVSTWRNLESSQIE